MLFQSYVMLFVLWMLLGAMAWGFTKLVFRRFGAKSYLWNGTGFPMGMALTMSYPFGVAAVLVSMFLAGVAGLLGAWLFSKVLPKKQLKTL